MKKVFEVLRQNELYVKREKCSFAQREVMFLGHRIKGGEIQMDQAKVQAIMEWEPPTKCDGVTIIPRVGELLS